MVKVNHEIKRQILIKYTHYTFSFHDKSYYTEERLIFYMQAAKTAQKYLLAKKLLYVDTLRQINFISKNTLRLQQPLRIR